MLQHPSRPAPPWREVFEDHTGPSLGSEMTQIKSIQIEDFAIFLIILILVITIF